MACRDTIPVLLALVVCASSGFAASPPIFDPTPASASGPALPGDLPSAAGLTAKPQPALPGSKTAADTFRELLEMSPADRAQALAGRTEHQRAYIEGELREYEALSRDEREARLQRLDLTCHLPVLMRTPPANRAERLANVPPTIRPLVDERLRQWDLLPSHVQQAVLEHETTANYFLRVRPTAATNANAAPFPLGPATPAASDRASRIREQFDEFFELPVKEQRKTLAAFPPAEREDMERALKVFASLSAEQRKACIDSFGKFSQMSKEQRDQFLKNAARWQAMSPRERETWRALIGILPPTPPPSNQLPVPTGAFDQPLQPDPASSQQRHQQF